MRREICSQILRGERHGAQKIVIEAVFHRRADAVLNFRIKLEYGLGQEVGTRMAVHLERFRRVGVNLLHLILRGTRRKKMPSARRLSLIKLAFSFAMN